MAIRLRKINNKWVALCAAEFKAKEGDVYLDDGQHDALTNKFLVDLCQEKPETNDLIKRQERV